MVSIAANNYTIYFKSDSYTYLNSYLNDNNFSKIFFIVDENTNNLCLPKLLPYISTTIPFEIIELEPGEENKTIATCVQVWEALLALGADRKSLVINVGGGVITDMGAFIASTYKRGIPFINIPTTLLAMVDASVGGKNGVDLGGLKNQIGTITNPAMLLIDTDYLETLPQREIKAGFAEMLKHGLIANKNHWYALQNYTDITFSELEELIFQSVQIKNNIVMQDPTEKGIRKALNFGHTLGHAIETHFLQTPNPLLHGEAIAIGMILESYIAKTKQLITQTQYTEIKNTINHIFDQTKIDAPSIQAILELLIYDKKNEYGEIQFTLIDTIGNAIINQITDNKTINEAFNDYNN